MPRILVLTNDEVARLLTMATCIELMAEALAGLARGQAEQPLRLVVRPPGAAGVMALMPAYRGGSAPAFGLKSIGVFPGNLERGLDSHQGALMLFDGDTGELRALLNASEVTAIRTAAVSAVATRVLAREDAGDLAILGSGVQARSHLVALALVRRLRRVRVASLRFNRARAFAAEQGGHGFPVEAVATAEEAVRGADLVVTATSAAEPVLRGEWIGPGTHLNVVGASLPDRREVDGATMAAARVYVDRRESAENEAGDYRLAVGEGAIPKDHIRAELGEVLIGKAPGRSGPDEITLFKSLGLAVEDLWSAAYLYERAREAGGGAWVEL